MVGRSRADAAATREALLDAAEAAFLERGVSRTSLDEIARRAGVTRGAVYWHFRNKADLFSAMLDRVRLPMAELLEELGPQRGADPLAALHELCVYALRSLASNPRRQRVYTILFHRSEMVGSDHPVAEQQARLAGETIELLEQTLQQAQRQGALNRALDTAAAAYAVHAFLTGLYRDWLRDPERFDVGVYAEPLLDTLFYGLAAGGGVSQAAAGSAR